VYCSTRAGTEAAARVLEESTAETRKELGGLGAASGRSDGGDADGARRTGSTDGGARRQTKERKERGPFSPAATREDRDVSAGAEHGVEDEPDAGWAKPR
jgi:hypothetical protein